MQAFEYVTASKRDQVATLLGGDGSILAGGTDLIALMKDDVVVVPKRLVNIKQIDGLGGISYQPGSGLRLGALVTLAQLADDVTVQQHFPVLTEAAREAASVQIRNLATLGGNMCQRPRDWYFRNGMGLLAMKDGKSLLREGDNRYAAILGNDGPALFVSPSTVAPVLIALGAKIRLYSAKSSGTGVRELALEKFFVIPTGDGQREHDLQAGEMVTEIVVPPPSKSLKASSYEVRQRAAFDWPLAHAAVALEMNGNTVKSARVVLGQVAPVPWISAEAAAALVGKPVNDATAMAAANAAVAQAKPLSHNKYKVTLAKAAVKRAILNAAAGRVGGAA
jgi:xanthine dehydrogenase YagS FAD-binding subunit